MGDRSVSPEEMYNFKWEGNIISFLECLEGLLDTKLDETIARVVTGHYKGKNPFSNIFFINK